MTLSNCPICRGEVSFHQHETDCPEGCHHLMCEQCGSCFDLSLAADPDNTCETLQDLRQKITGIWNRQQEQQWNTYQRGWVAAAGWAQRNDLVSDIDSPAYEKEREQRLK